MTSPTLPGSRTDDSFSRPPSLSPDSQHALKVKAIHTELPKPQSPMKVTKLKTGKTYAQNPDEIVPLAGSVSPCSDLQDPGLEFDEEFLQTHVVLKGASKKWTNV